MQANAFFHLLDLHLHRPLRQLSFLIVSLLRLVLLLGFFDFLLQLLAGLKMHRLNLFVKLVQRVDNYMDVLPLFK